MQKYRFSNWIAKAVLAGVWTVCSGMNQSALAETIAAVDPSQSQSAIKKKDVNPAPREQQQPPQVKDVEWFRIPYDKAEDELLGLLQRDLPKIEEFANELAVYEVKTSENYPADHYKRLRSKLEKVFSFSKKLRIKQCPACEESRLYRTESGELKYESFSTDLKRPSKLASELGVNHFVYTEISYQPEDVQLTVKVVQPSNGNIAWVKEYSVADVVKTRESFQDADPEELSHRDALSRVIIGEIAFSMTLAPGLFMVPSINTGNGTELGGLPSVDLTIGERFDRGRKMFGFLIGGAFNTGSIPAKGNPVPYVFRFAPRYAYIFNPYNVTTARYSVAGEFGAIISDNVASAYIGIGPEVKMINRFALGLMPMYILPAKVGNIPSGAAPGEVPVDAPSGKFGGLALMMKVLIQW